MSSATSGVSNNLMESLRQSYDRLADEYSRRMFNELSNKPLDRELLNRFVSEVAGQREICDIGCGPGHVARYLRDAGARVFGLDLSPRMLEQARGLSPDIRFQEGDIMALDFPDGTLAGIVAFYIICNIPKESLPIVFREMEGVLQPDGLLLISFHNGDEVIHENERWGKAISMDSFLYQSSVIRQYLERSGFLIEDLIEREPYAPDIEYQSRRTYIFARKRK